MKITLISLLLFIVFALLLFNAWFYTQQPNMLFYPGSELDATPADWGLAYEDIELTTSDSVRLHSWYLPAKATKQVVLFFHGNAGNISHRGESLQVFHGQGLSVLIVDYRGYGKSGGEPSEQGFYRDAMAAWKYLIEQRGYQPQDVIIFGRSLGGAVATQLATKVQAKALIIESTFSSMSDMANTVMPLISKLVFSRYNFNTEAIIPQVKSPVLVMHSPDDDIIPYSLGVKVYAAANSPKYFYKLRGGHNGGFVESQPGYEQAIKSFLK